MGKSQEVATNAKVATNAVVVSNETGDKDLSVFKAQKTRATIEGKAEKLAQDVLQAAIDADWKWSEVFVPSNDEYTGDKDGTRYHLMVKATIAGIQARPNGHGKFHGHMKGPDSKVKNIDLEWLFYANSRKLSKDWNKIRTPFTSYVTGMVGNFRRQLKDRQVPKTAGATEKRSTYEIWDDEYTEEMKRVAKDVTKFPYLDVEGWETALKAARKYIRDAAQEERANAEKHD